MSEDKEALTARAMIKRCYEDKEVTIHERSYVFGKMIHKNRLQVYAYSTKIAPMLKVGDMSFMGTEEWSKIMSLISRHVLFDDMQLSKLEDHWDKYPGDYLLFCTTALPVISYPFLDASPTA